MHCEVNLCLVGFTVLRHTHSGLFSKAQWTPNTADAQAPYPWLSLPAGSASTHTEGQLHFLEGIIGVEGMCGLTGDEHTPPTPTRGFWSQCLCLSPSAHARGWAEGRGGGGDYGCKPIKFRTETENPRPPVSGPTPVALCPQVFAGCPKVESN